MFLESKYVKYYDEPRGFWSQSISDISMTSSSNSLFHNTSNTIVLKTNNVYILYLKKTISPPRCGVLQIYGEARELGLQELGDGAMGFLCHGRKLDSGAILGDGHQSVNIH